MRTLRKTPRLVRQLTGARLFSRSVNIGTNSSAPSSSSSSSEPADSPSDSPTNPPIDEPKAPSAEAGKTLEYLRSVYETVAAESSNKKAIATAAHLLDSTARRQGHRLSREFQDALWRKRVEKGGNRVLLENTHGETLRQILHLLQELTPLPGTMAFDQQQAETARLAAHIAEIRRTSRRRFGGPGPKFLSVPPLPVSFTPERFEVFVYFLTYHRHFRRVGGVSEADMLRQLLRPSNQLTRELRTTQVYNYVLRYFIRKNNWAFVWKLPTIMELDGAAPNTETFNSLLFVIAQTVSRPHVMNGFDAAARVLRTMRRSGCSADSNTWAQIIRLVRPSGDVSAFVQAMLEREVPVRGDLVGQLGSVMARLMEPPQLLAWAEETPHVMEEPAAIEAVFSALAAVGDGPRMWRLLESRGGKLAVFSRCVDKCMKLKRPDYAMSLFATFEQPGADALLYCELVKSLCSRGRFPGWQRAVGAVFGIMLAQFPLCLREGRVFRLAASVVLADLQEVEENWRETESGEAMAEEREDQSEGAKALEGLEGESERDMKVEGETENRSIHTSNITQSSSSSSRAPRSSSSDISYLDLPSAHSLNPTISLTMTPESQDFWFTAMRVMDWNTEKTFDYVEASPEKQVVLSALGMDPDQVGPWKPFPSVNIQNETYFKGMSADEAERLKKLVYRSKYLVGQLVKQLQDQPRQFSRGLRNEDNSEDRTREEKGPFSRRSGNWAQWGSDGGSPSESA